MAMAKLFRTLLCGLLACVLVCPAAFAATETYAIAIVTKAKAKGGKGTYFDTVTLTFFDNGTFTTDDINAGTWTGDEKKRVLQVAFSDIETLVETIAADELGIAVDLVSVASVKGSAKVKGDTIKGSLKVKGVVDVHDEALFGVKFSISIKFAGTRI
ncbi:MAG: hypothetical protein ABIF82_00385 [Planctomycetota bacterium]